jgi:hypothetical protein
MIGDEQAAIESELDLDPPSGQAASAMGRWQLENRALDPDGVVVADDTPPAEGADALELRGAGAGRQAGVAMLGGTAKLALNLPMKRSSTALAEASSSAPARRSSDTSRSWQVPHSRSTRPLAWAEAAGIELIPSSRHIRLRMVR